MVVVAVAPFALGGGPATRGTDLVPAPPWITDSPSAGADLFEPRQGAPVDIDLESRELVFEPGAVVRQRTDGVAQDIDGRSASLVIDFDGDTYWVVMAWDERRGDVVRPADLHRHRQEPLPPGPREAEVGPGRGPDPVT